MTFKYVTSERGGTAIHCSEHDHWIPLNPANSDYQLVLDKINELGADAFDGDIPADLQEAADTKLFNQQLSDYTTAVARLAQYQVALGREEVTEMMDTTEQQVDADGMPVVDDEGNPVYVQEEVITVTAIEPVEATVERTVYGDDPDAEPTVEVIENPLITQDNLERAEAQAVVDATPQEVKDVIP